MKSRRRGILSMLDDTVRWTGMPARVAKQMSDDPSVDRKHRPLRWSPIWPIACSCVLLMISLAWPAALDRVSPGITYSITVVFWCVIFGMMPGIHANGPLGKPSLEDDEREAALRKDSFLICLGLLAVLNCLGQPLLMILSHWQDWQFEQTASVVATAFMLNASLLGCLPTLYASWNLRQLPNE
jgi:hypothetical protein